jgi:hypothetical protein
MNVIEHQQDQLAMPDLRPVPVRDRLEDFLSNCGVAKMIFATKFRADRDEVNSSGSYPRGDFMIQPWASSFKHGANIPPDGVRRLP